VNRGPTISSRSTPRVISTRPPEFFHGWRFLFVRVRWWIAKVRGRAEDRVDRDPAQALREE